MTDFPVESYRDAAPHLRRPFTPAAVKFKVQATWPKGNPTGALIVSYIDARLVVERLNLICPHLWHDEYGAADKGLMWCSLTVDGITRRDVGEGDGKGLVSDALKRAAVKFGIGVSLYATPKMTLNAGPHAKVKGQGDRATLVLTPAGESEVRRIYAAWLKSHGIQAFGEPLNHGDVENSQGDAEVAEEPPSVPETTPRRQLPVTLVNELRKGYVLTGWDVPALRRHLEQFGVKAVEDLSIEQAQELLTIMSAAIDVEAPVMS